MPPVLEIRSETPLSEPILQLAVQMSCGIEVVRQYVLLASPIQDRATSLLTLPLVPEIQRAPIENVHGPHEFAVNRRNILRPSQNGYPQNVPISDRHRRACPIV